MKKDKFKIGDKIKHPKYGIGVVRQISRIPGDEFHYDVDFSIRGGDGTKVWLHKRKTEKVATKLED